MGAFTFGQRVRRARLLSAFSVKECLKKCKIKSRSTWHRAESDKPISDGVRLRILQLFPEILETRT